MSPTLEIPSTLCATAHRSRVSAYSIASPTVSSARAPFLMSGNRQPLASLCSAAPRQPRTRQEYEQDGPRRPQFHAEGPRDTAAQPSRSESRQKRGIQDSAGEPTAKPLTGTLFHSPSLNPLWRYGVHSIVISTSKLAATSRQRGVFVASVAVVCQHSNHVSGYGLRFLGFELHSELLPADSELRGTARWGPGRILPVAESSPLVTDQDILGVPFGPGDCQDSLSRTFGCRGALPPCNAVNDDTGSLHGVATVRRPRSMDLAAVHESPVLLQRALDVSDVDCACRSCHSVTSIYSRFRSQGHLTNGFAGELRHDHLPGVAFHVVPILRI